MQEMVICAAQIVVHIQEMGPAINAELNGPRGIAFDDTFN